ncbi:MAG: DEAD/DEAH box helicase family protein [Candidatus Roizmanbacteria bacterium]
MKLQFDPDQPFQLEAIQSITDLFDGQTLNKSEFTITHSQEASPLFNSSLRTEIGIRNNLTISEDTILQNLHKVQKQNEIPVQTTLDHGLNFTIEMETGTGKTYVYLRTILELNKLYGFLKFIIVVPSVAIREGVIKNLEITKKHFEKHYNNIVYHSYTYDSKNLDRVASYAKSNQIEIMIMNIDSFNKDFSEEDRGNVIFRKNEGLQWNKPIEYISMARPIVIIDEPQSVDTGKDSSKNKKAITALNPLFILRYSATHREEFNLVYKLDPIKSFELGLVKQIMVASVEEEKNFNGAYVKLVAVDNKNGIKAKITIHEQTNDGLREKTLWVKNAQDLFYLSGEQFNYKNNFIIEDISTELDFEYIRFQNGTTVRLGETLGGEIEEVKRKIQIKNTIREHLNKEYQLLGKGIKVLSLFFIDKVLHYRDYDNEGHEIKGKFAQWFEEAYNQVIQEGLYKDLPIKRFSVDQLHNGYFAIDNKKWVDTTGKTKRDTQIYDLIMKEKEKLLSEEEPLRFIFSHSALREGWDNPNVFQICTLNYTQGEIKKRQEIGRGLRIAVNNKGERVWDKSINRLVVIANESYELFAKALQNEYEDETKIKFNVIKKEAFANIQRTLGSSVRFLGKDQSADIWYSLQKNGYLDTEGHITDKFQPENILFQLEIDMRYKDIQPSIVDVLVKKQFKRIIQNARDRKKAKLNIQVYNDADFKTLWNKINKRTTYSVKFSTQDLVHKSAEKIREMEEVVPVQIVYRKGAFDITEAGVITNEVKRQTTQEDFDFPLPDILSYIQDQTELTRDTICNILIQSGRLDDFPKNPQRFMDLASRNIRDIMHDLSIHGIVYEQVDGDTYNMRLFEEEKDKEIFENISVESNKSIYNIVQYDSSIERDIVMDMNKREDIKLFIKLPNKFRIQTPIGDYIPDWAIVKGEGSEEKIYFVRETKSTTDLNDLRNSEAAKIQCGKKHFESLGVDYAVITGAKEI